MFDLRGTESLYLRELSGAAADSKEAREGLGRARSPVTKTNSRNTVGVTKLKKTPRKMTRDEAAGIEKKLVSHLPHRADRPAEQNVQIAIIMQAVRDLRRADKKMRYEALAFLEGFIGGIEQVSTLAGIDHGYILRVINAVYHSEPQKVAA